MRDLAQLETRFLKRVYGVTSISPFESRANRLRTRETGFRGTICQDTISHGHLATGGESTMAAERSGQAGPLTLTQRLLVIGRQPADPVESAGIEVPMLQVQRLNRQLLGLRELTLGGMGERQIVERGIVGRICLPEPAARKRPLPPTVLFGQSRFPC